MKFLCFCILFASAIAVLNGASIKQHEEQANGEQAAKRELLVKKLRELLKSTTADGNNKEERSNAAGKNAQGVVSKQADAENVRSSRREKMVRRLKSARGRQLSASARKQTSHSNEGMIQALRKRISAVTSEKQKTPARKQLIGQNLLNRKFGPTVQRQKTRGPSSTTAKRTNTTPKKTQRSPNKRLTLQAKRQYPDSTSAYPACESCSLLLPNNNQYQSDYLSNNPSDHQSTSDYSSHNHEAAPLSPIPAPYYHPDFPGTDGYPQDEWSKCYEMNSSYNRTCDVPCMYEYGNEFFWCFIVESYFLNQDLEDVYYGMNTDMCHSAELECRLGNLMEELAFRIARDTTDPYMTDPYMPDPYIPGPYMPDPNMLDPYMPVQNMPDPYMPSSYIPGPYMSDPSMPGPNMPDPNMLDPYMPVQNMPDPFIPGSYIPGPYMSDPSMPDPNMPDPNMLDPYIPGSYIPGPYMSDPLMTNPSMTEPSMTDPYMTDPLMTNPYMPHSYMTDPNMPNPYMPDPNMTDP